jgi:hypothetical protein
MKRSTREFLLAFALWGLGLGVYAVSLSLPWFNFHPGSQVPIARSELLISGRDSFHFLLERLWGGCFVWLAHPILWVGWLLLVCYRWRAATVAGCVALALALNVPLVFQPREGPWFPPGVGYYLWFGSMALLACSALVRNFFFRSDPVAANEAFRRLAEQQRVVTAELAELKQRVADLVDHQAATFLEEMETRNRSGFSQF